MNQQFQEFRYVRRFDIDAASVLSFHHLSNWDATYNAPKMLVFAGPKIGLGFECF